jgi:glycosyltransferase involved in cell wall biosynthesis
MPAGKRIRVGIFTQSWDLGGVCTFCQNLGDGLEGAGYDVTYILTRGYKPRDPYARLSYQAWKSRSAAKVLDLGLKWVPRRLRQRSFERQITAANLDSLILNNADQFLQPLERLASNLRLINVSHGDLAGSTYRVFAQTQNFCQRQVAISHAIYDSMLTMSPTHLHPNIRLVHNGVKQEKERPKAWNDNQLRVAYCGRFDPVQKRIGDLPRIWKAFLQRGGKGTLHLVGAGEGEDLLRRELAREIADQSVIMHGFVVHHQVPEILRECEVILNLSNWEGLPFSVLEGMSSGCYPLLSSIRSGHPDILQACGGGSFQTGDVEEVAEKLDCLRMQKGDLLRDRLNIWMNARKHFDLTEMTGRYIELIENA